MDWTGEGTEAWEERFRSSGAQRVPAILRQSGIPARLAEALTHELGLADRQIAQLKKSEMQALLKSLASYPLDCSGHEGYPKALPFSLSI